MFDPKKFSTGSKKYKTLKMVKQAIEDSGVDGLTAKPFHILGSVVIAKNRQDKKLISVKYLLDDVLGGCLAPTPIKLLTQF